MDAEKGVGQERRAFGECVPSENTLSTMLICDDTSTTHKKIKVTVFSPFLLDQMPVYWFRQIRWMNRIK